MTSTAFLSRKFSLCAYAGKEVYVDVQGWHLFLKEITVEKDVKMHQVDYPAHDEALLFEQSTSILLRDVSKPIYTCI